MAFVYALVDPVTDEVRYIGRAIANPFRRWQRHIDEASKNLYSTKKLNWIRELVDQGMLPKLVIVEEGNWTSSELNLREQWWIHHLRSTGNDLVNITGGGELDYEWVRTNTYRFGSGWRGKELLPETKEKMSKSHKRRWTRLRAEGRTEEVRANISAGTKLAMANPVVQEKMKVAQELRAAARESNRTPKLPISEEELKISRKKMSQAAKNFWDNLSDDDRLDHAHKIQLGRCRSKAKKLGYILYCVSNCTCSCKSCKEGKK